MKKSLALFLALNILCLGTAFASGGAEGFFDVADDAELVDASFLESEDAAAPAADIEITAPSAILIEKETGTVIYEKDADKKREPASVTKVMTMLLIIEELESGTVAFDDMVSVSAYAASMGGSQIFLEEGERMSVRDMLKSIVVSSANDASVAMAEFISGSEQAFTARMNERAGELGMTNTVFTNCSGLKDDPEHVTTARDIAVMSRELMRHDVIKDFTKIWMDTVRNGAFGLSNTNKLIRYYDGATGLKTGFTSRSMYCLSATAERGGVEYIAVIMAEETSVKRFESAKTLLSYAFANYTVADALPDEALPPVIVELGKVWTVQPVVKGAEHILVKKKEAAALTKTVRLEERVKAPVEAGARLGTFTISSGERVLGEFEIVAADEVERITWGDAFIELIRMLFASAVER